MGFYFRVLRSKLEKVDEKLFFFYFWNIVLYVEGTYLSTWNELVRQRLLCRKDFVWTIIDILLWLYVLSHRLMEVVQRSARAFRPEMHSSEWTPLMCTLCGTKTRRTLSARLEEHSSSPYNGIQLLLLNKRSSNNRFSTNIESIWIIATNLLK